MSDIAEEVKRENSVQEKWHVPKPKKKKDVLWCDASSVAMAVCVEVEGIIDKDAA